MDKDIKDSIRTLSSIWEGGVSNKADTLIHALQADNFTPQEKNICSGLIEAFKKGELDAEEIKNSMNSVETTQKKEIERLEKFVNILNGPFLN